MEETRCSPAMITILLPYERVVYDVAGESSNAVRCDRSRTKRKKRIWEIGMESSYQFGLVDFDRMNRYNDRGGIQNNPGFGLK